jgi:glycosyltransferase involved in cell wall biosynthesis
MGPGPGKTAPAASLSAVALVDWYWGGHHPTYFAHFVLALEQLGLRVLALCPQPEDARKAVSQLREISGFGDGTSRTEFRDVPRPSGGRWLPSRFFAAKQTIKRFCAIDRFVRAWQRETGTATCEIFYSCMYEWDFERFRYAQPFLAFRWSGLYMRAASLSTGDAQLNGRQINPQLDRISQDRRLKGLAILDEGIRGGVAERIGRTVVVFPDFTDERLPSTQIESRLAERLRAFAGDRPIVGLFGYLQRSKGLTTFCSAAQNPALTHVCFAIVGDVDWLSFTAEERHAIQKWLAEADNVWTHLARVPDEPQLNGLMAACDVLFGSYIDFPYSSNILAKSAVLQKPVIVSDGSLMAERVRRFRLGEIIPQEDPSAAAGAMLRILQDVDAWLQRHRPAWEDYRRQHCFEALKSAFAKMYGHSDEGLALR